MRDWEKFSSKRGGAREGAGRPTGNTKNWKKFSTVISPEMFKWLEKCRKAGMIKSRIINNALMEHKERLKEGKT